MSEPKITVCPDDPLLASWPLAPDNLLHRVVNGLRMLTAAEWSQLGFERVSKWTPAERQAKCKHFFKKRKTGGYQCHKCGAMTSGNGRKKAPVRLER